MTEQQLKNLISSCNNIQLDDRSSEQVGIYSMGGEIMAVVKNGSQPVQVSLRCDSNLAKLLCDKYESVLPSHRLNKRRFVTILLTGQLSDDEIRDQVRHAYEETSQLLRRQN